MGLSIDLDLFPLTAALLAAISCGLLGNFLVLRRLSLMGDAISHSVLPGLVIAFVLTASRSPLAMFTGALAAGVSTVLLVELVKRLGRVEPGAAMGVVFSVLFALGVLLLEVSDTSGVDLDAECVLHGQLETLVWYGAPKSWGEFWQPGSLRAVPQQVWTLAIMLVLAAGFVGALFKELRIAAFDPALSTTLGFSATGLHLALMVFVAGATVASFEAVGSILVIAMLICPAATARLLTDRLRSQLLVSVLVAVVSCAAGYIAATAVPAWFGLDSVNAAGSMAVMAGAVLTLAVFASPRHGVIARRWRLHAMGRSIARDDLLASLYREAEASSAMPQRPRAHASAKRSLVRDGLIDDATDSLTAAGKAEAQRVIRRHRLWESYLADQVGLAPDHVHETAERLEHLRLAPTGEPPTDPHGKPIPPEPPA